jgi:predicted transcriptional regulator
VSLVKKETEDVLKTRATSNVLFQLIVGKRSPIEMSRAIGDTSPAVIKQLWRLRKAGIVKLAEKTGKFQNYDVIWERLIEEAVDRMVNLATALLLSSLTHNVKRYNLLDSLKGKLKKNKQFQSLFRTFLEEEARRRETRDVYLITTETFQDAVDKFEKFLPKLLPSLKADPEKAELLSVLKTLCDAIEEANDFEAVPLKNALQKIGFL